ncbi:DUF2622 domain-containing protein [Providencia rettgeri]|uniref:DUF2622 domain-containing protein n=1 Tax=Providencia TaxID=586 RepID=UPI002572D557|nr:DUF2622 domain-containing protein [Providencia rettgeri]MDL9982864.1 DUF2622 domain-containing protein [Providencia rettgeri]MDY0820002.1 DUF2622 domain-containing protein [Providencia rettgeri]
MVKCTIRVELPNANYDDYQNLHERMKNSGFHKYIRSDDGVWYNLPDAEYNYDGPLDLDGVFQSAVNVAKSIRVNAKVLVTESVARRWFNLDQV